MGFSAELGRVWTACDASLEGFRDGSSLVNPNLLMRWTCSRYKSSKLQRAPETLCLPSMKSSSPSGYLSPQTLLESPHCGGKTCWHKSRARFRGILHPRRHKVSMPSKSSSPNRSTSPTRYLIVLISSRIHPTKADHKFKTSLAFSELFPCRIHKLFCLDLSCRDSIYGHRLPPPTRNHLTPDNIAFSLHRLDLLLSKARSPAR